MVIQFNKESVLHDYFKLIWKHSQIRKHRRNMHIFDSFMYADVEQEGFDTLFEEHPGGLSNIKRAFSKACKTKLQEILYESEN